MVSSFALSELHVQFCFPFDSPSIGKGRCMFALEILRAANEGILQAFRHAG